MKMPDPERPSTGIGIWIVVGLLLLLAVGAVGYFAPIAACPLCEHRDSLAAMLGRFDPADCAFCNGRMKMTTWERWKTERFVNQASEFPRR